MFKKTLFGVILALSLLPGTLGAYPFWGKDPAVPLADPFAGFDPRKNSRSPIEPYVKERTAVGDCNFSQQCLAFYAKHLEHKEPQIAQDAFDNVVRFPFETIRDNLDSLPVAKMRRYALDRKIAPERRDFYCFVIGLKKQYADRSIISEVTDEFIAKEGLQNTRMVGLLAGYALSGSNFAQQMFLKILRFPQGGVHGGGVPQHATDVIDTLEFLKENAPGTVDAWSSNILRLALDLKSPLQLRALELATRWNDPSLTNRLLDTMKRDGAPADLRDAAVSYCDTIRDEYCKTMVFWLQERDSVMRTGAGTAPVPSTK